MTAILFSIIEGCPGYLSSKNKEILVRYSKRVINWDGVVRYFNKHHLEVVESSISHKAATEAGKTAEGSK